MRFGNGKGSSLWGNHAPVCPYCDAKYEFDYFHHEESVIELQCGTCDKTFFVQVRPEILFDTVGDCLKNGNGPHELEEDYPKGHYECRKCYQEFYTFDRQMKKRPEDFVFIEEKKQEKKE